jgi:protein gp37
VSESTKIQWCDHTANFWSGCTKVSPGCAHCYAEARDKRHMIEKVDHWGPGAPRLKSKSAVKDCLRWNKKPWICSHCGHSWAGEMSRPDPTCPKCDVSHMGHRARVFSLSLGDWLDSEAPIEWLAEMMDMIRQCKNLDFLLCTKRPELWSRRIREARNFLTSGGDADTALMLHNWLPHPETPGMPATAGTPPHNIWILTSTENQEQLEKRVPQLLKIPAVVHGLSCEPLLGPICFGGERIEWLSPFHETDAMLNKTPRIDWIIAGGESGPSARPCNLEWLQDIQEQCAMSSVAYFCKQLGSSARISFNNEVGELTSTALLHLKDKKGGDPSEWPADMDVRQWPTVIREL